MLFFLLEAGMITFMRQDFGHEQSALIFFGLSLAIGVAGIYLAFTNTQATLQREQPIPFSKQFFLYSYTTVGILLSALLLNKIMKVMPIDIKYSDIIPQVSVLVNRLLYGEFPYKVISDWGYDLFPTYLPLQWLPFTFAEALNVDYRWISFAIFFSSIIAFAVFALRKKITTERYAILLLVAFATFISLAKGEPTILGATIETMIAGFYLLLSLSIFSKSNVWRALGILVCLLSRYSLVLWLPLYILILFFVESKRNAIIISSICAIGVLVIYVLPFLSVDGDIFFNAYSYHSKAALGEWSGQSWQQPGEKPVQLFRGVGFASVFYDTIDGDLTTRLGILQKAHLIITLLVVAVLGFIFYKFKNKLNYQTYLLASLKIYLVVFYNFIQIPYTYLFVTVIVVSLPILAIAMMSPQMASVSEESE